MSLKLPPELERLRLQTGVHRKFLHFLVFGGWKTGKSTFLSHMPRPLLGIDCGEGGIAGYLPKDAPDVDVIYVTNPEQYTAAIDFAIAHEKDIASVAVDPLSELWTDHLDYWNEKLPGEEIRGSQWRFVKGPWKYNLRRLMRASFNVGYSAWVKDVEYIEEDAGPGEKGSLIIRPQVVPQIERTVGYTLDMIFETAVRKDKLNRPTPRHEVTYWGGRRPLSVPANELYIGRKWTFDARNPVSVWETVIAPLLPKWDDGAVEHLGIDPKEAGKALKEMDQIAEDVEVGRLVRLIEEQTDETRYAQHVWPTEIAPTLMQLPPEAVARVRKAHEAKKKEWAK